MSGDIVLSAALRNNLLSLQSTQRNIDVAQLRLATGLKVNSALDNPQNFFTAKALNNRANDLTRLLDGISQSIRTIEQANTGVESISDFLDQAESIALDAQAEIRANEGFTRIRGDANISASVDLEDGVIIDAGVSDEFTLTVNEPDGTNTVVAITVADGYTVDNIVADINSDALVGPLVTARVTSAGFLEIQSDVENATLRITGTGNAVTAAGFIALGLGNIIGTEDDAANISRQGGTAVAGNTLVSAVAADAALGADGIHYDASATLDDAGYSTLATDDFNLNLVVDGVTTAAGGGAIYTDASTIQDIIDGINNPGATGVTATFNIDTGRIELEFAQTVGQFEFEIAGNAATDLAFGFGYGDGSAGSDVLLANNQFVSELFTFDGVTANVDQYEEDFNNVRTQINQLVEDANYRGVNLLDGDNLTTFFNEDYSHTLETEGTDFSASGLGISIGVFTNAASVQLSLDSIRTATETVRSFGQSIANDLAIVQFRRDFTEQTINTLTAGAEDLTIADQNEEGANLLALQTRQALGTTSLSLAAQSQQAVLRLF